MAPPHKRGMSLRKIAEDTLSSVEKGFYLIDQVSYNLAPQLDLSKQQTVYYSPDSELGNWPSAPSPTERPSDIPATDISILEISTLDGARHLSNIIADQSSSIARSGSSKIGILNFASAKNPGGGFIRGAQAQEESIARSSTLYPALMTDTAQAFYRLHKRDPKGGYYSHAMIYSPHVVLFRDDDGGWTEPLEVDVVTSPAVNAGVARRTLHGMVGGQAEEGRIEKAMRERMARILFLFEKKETKNIVLGSFGTGVFRNNVGMVARIWADLLAVKDARFKNAFDRVVFAIIGKKTFDEFKDAFEQRVKGGDGA